MPLSRVMGARPARAAICLLEREPTINEEVRKFVKTYVEYPPRRFQSEVYTGPITLTQYQRLQHVRELLKNEGISLLLPTGN
jgi:arylsulfatase